MGTPSFTKALTHWHETENARSLPWKEEKDPYKIWLSEIILQQTRAAQGLPYYLNFINTYPTINLLAAAADEEVFRLWQGLGYYSRCKNMLTTARFVRNTMGGKFPETASEIQKLKGIGPYTAAAIASFAFNEPVAVVDGNVYRVLGRYLGIDIPYDTTAGKKTFFQLAEQHLDKANSATYNQAIMDLGATICTPKAPRCSICPVRQGCIAFRQGTVLLLPVKSKKIKVNTRYFNYVLFRQNGHIWIQKREAKDIWENLHQPFLIETEEPENTEGIAARLISLGIPIAGSLTLAGSSAQRLTHRIIKATFYIAEASGEIPGGIWYTGTAINQLAFPKTVNDFLLQNQIIKKN